MPSKKTRIALTVEDDLNHVLSELSELTGEPKTKLICDVLNDIVPVYKELVETLKEAKQKKDTLPALAKWSAKANQQVAFMNNEMSKLYQKEGEK
jgi:hypothetical protein